MPKRKQNKTDNETRTNGLANHSQKAYQEIAATGKK